MIDVAEGMAFPGSSRVEEVALNLCLERFDEFVGTPYYDSLLDIEAFSPTRDSWEDIDDREVTFIAVRHRRSLHGRIHARQRPIIADGIYLISN